MPRLERIGAIVALLLVGAACGSSGQETTVMVSLSDLPCEMTSAAGIWESHPSPPITDPQCEWLEFRGNTTYEIEHPLDRTPFVIIGYISFEANGSFSSIATGNTLVVQAADDSSVLIRNAQNQLFYLRLVLE